MGRKGVVENGQLREAASCAGNSLDMERNGADKGRAHRQCIYQQSLGDAETKLPLITGWVDRLSLPSWHMRPLVKVQP